MRPLVSIIIPVYNVEPYIQRCLDSVINQTYTNLEIFLVDDGSTDKSGLICDEYAKKDVRIIVHHQKNAGVSSARNWALDRVNGEYIAFVDPDDFIHSQLIQVGMEASKDNDADIVMYSYALMKDGTYQIHREKKILLDEKNKHNELLCNILTNKWPNYLWQAIYKKKLWNDNRFPSSYVRLSDLYLLPHVFGVAKNIIFLKNTLYFYNIANMSSLTNIAKQVELFDVKNRYLIFRAYKEHIKVAKNIGKEAIKRKVITKGLRDAIKLMWMNFSSNTSLTAGESQQVLLFLKNYNRTVYINKLSLKYRILFWSELYCPFVYKLYSFIRYNQERIKRISRNNI